MPYFENRQNISGEAGITGNNQDPTNWGPPALAFSSGIAQLMDQQSAFNRNRTDAFSESIAIYRGRHNITIGGDLRKQQYNDFFQQDPRGTFTFTGAATQGTAGGVTTAALTWPTSSSACRIPAPSPSAMPTNISAKPSTTSTLPTTGASLPTSPSTPACAGITARP